LGRNLSLKKGHRRSPVRMPIVVSVEKEEINKINYAVKTFSKLKSQRYPLI